MIKAPCIFLLFELDCSYYELTLVLYGFIVCQPVVFIGYDKSSILMHHRMYLDIKLGTINHWRQLILQYIDLSAIM